MYSQSTLTLILLETLGGTPLLAMHKYAPISRREILVSSNDSPSHSSTVRRGMKQKQSVSTSLTLCQVEYSWTTNRSKFFPMDILELSSRRHLIAGSGLPVARQRNVTFAPSRTITSLEVVESSIFGGTAKGQGVQTTGLLSGA